jgi:hypothetical protein
MVFKVGDTLDLVGHKGKKTPVQIISESNDVYTIQYLDNSGRPAGTCRASELVKREKTGEVPKVEERTSTEATTVKVEETPEQETSEATPEEAETEPTEAENPEN